jgi:hypothetical protein
MVLVEPEAGNLLPSRLSEPLGKKVEVRGIPHLAKNERDVGHPSFVEGKDAKRLDWNKLCSSMRQEFG